MSESLSRKFCHLVLHKPSPQASTLQFWRSLGDSSVLKPLSQCTSVWLLFAIQGISGSQGEISLCSPPTLSTWSENKSFGDKDISNADGSPEISRRDQKKGERDEQACGRLVLRPRQGYRGNAGGHIAQFKVHWLILGSGRDVIIKISCIYLSRRICFSQ